MLHTVLLVVMGLALVGILSAIFEQIFAQAMGVAVADAIHIRLGLPIYMWTKILAAGVVVTVIRTHTWKWLLIATGLVILYLMFRKSSPRSDV